MTGNFFPLEQFLGNFLKGGRRRIAGLERLQFLRPETTQIRNGLLRSERVHWTKKSGSTTHRYIANNGRCGRGNLCHPTYP